MLFLCILTYIPPPRLPRLPPPRSAPRTAPSTTGQPCPDCHTDGTTSTQGQPQTDGRGRAAEKDGQRKGSTPEATQTAQRRPDCQRNRRHHPAPPAAPGLLPRSRGRPDRARRTDSTAPAEAERERERERGQRGRGSEEKITLKPPPFAHMPDWRHHSPAQATPCPQRPPDSPRRPDRPGEAPGPGSAFVEYAESALNNAHFAPMTDGG